MSQIKRHIIDWLMDRLQEQSTWKGLIFCAGALGIKIHPAALNRIAFLAFLSIGLINIFRTESKKRKRRKRKTVTII